jgi:hypothetical protein
VKEFFSKNFKKINKQKNIYFAKLEILAASAPKH